MKVKGEVLNAGIISYPLEFKGKLLIKMDGKFKKYKKLGKGYTEFHIICEDDDAIKEILKNYPTLGKRVIIGLSTEKKAIGKYAIQEIELKGKSFTLHFHN